MFKKNCSPDLFSSFSVLTLYHLSSFSFCVCLFFFFLPFSFVLFFIISFSKTLRSINSSLSFFSEIDKLDRELVGHKHAYLIKTIGMVLHNDDYGLTLPELSCRDIIDEVKGELGLKQWPLTKGKMSNVIEVTGLTRITTVGERALQVDEEDATGTLLCLVISIL